MVEEGLWETGSLEGAPYFTSPSDRLRSHELP